MNNIIVTTLTLGLQPTPKQSKKEINCENKLRKEKNLNTLKKLKRSISKLLRWTPTLGIGSHRVSQIYKTKMKEVNSIQMETKFVSLETS